MSEVRHDYVYAVTPIKTEGSPCLTNCSYRYKTSIPEDVFTPTCAGCGQKMKFSVVSKEVSENQW